MNRTYSTAAWVLASALLFGCAEDPDQLIASARESLQQHETQTAIIQLKNALQQRADSPEARFLLGRALLESGDGVAAAVEHLVRSAAERVADAGQEAREHPDG